jgi:hypothetical protein
MRTTQFGAPYRRAMPMSKVSVQVIEPSTGFDLAQPATDLRPGQTPFAQNFLMREGGLELRPTLTSYVSNPAPLDIITGGETIISSVASHYPLVSGSTRFAYFSAGSWSKLSYVSSGGRSTPPSGKTTDYYDIIQTYEPGKDDMIAVAGCESYQTLFCWQSGSAVLSTITGAPRAKYVCDFNNYVVALNIRDAGSNQSKYIQRVQWSDRGAPLTWSFGGSSLAGFEDLLDAKGQGTRIIPMDDRVIVFFEDEIWQGLPSTGNASFTFAPYDRSIGCPYGWTVAKTPLGIMFLGRDLMVYLLPKGGGPAAPVGYPVRRWIANRINNPQKSWAVYDPQTREYRLYYPIQGGTGLPQEALWINLGENSWAPQSYVHSTGQYSLTRGFVSYNDTASSDLTWGGANFAWNSTISTWADFAAVLGAANEAIAVGTSNGSMYYESNGTLDGPIPVTATWESAALGGDSPRNMKVLQEVRCDYQSSLPSTLTIAASRNAGATFDTAVRVPLTVSPVETNAVGYVYSVGQYPTFQVQISSNAVRLFRFQTQYTIGGSSA